MYMLFDFYRYADRSEKQRLVQKKCVVSESKLRQLVTIAIIIIPSLHVELWPRILKCFWLFVSDLMAHCLFERYINTGVVPTSEDSQRIAVLAKSDMTIAPKEQVVSRMMARKDMT